jgi:trans-2,3-dihydro-3-hydroxyanthranilate isomerase
MTAFRFLHLDVFTSELFGGNQLAVFPDARELPSRLMQAIAREMAFSETTFVLPPETTSTDVRMRIFTPSVEMPMAGHPVIGSTFALARAGRIPPGRKQWTFGLNIGPLLVDLEWRAVDLSFVWMTQRLPEFGRTFDQIDAIARAVGVSADDIRATKLPVQEVSCGVPFVLVPIPSREAVDRGMPDPKALADLARQAGSSHFAVYLFTTDRGEGRDQATVYTRMFAPGLGVFEDPATGSASGPLGCYLVRYAVIPANRAHDILNLQGVHMGRPSWIRIAIDAADGEISRVQVGGTAVHVAEGTLSVDSQESTGGV